MTNLTINERQFYYALWEESIVQEDEWGNETGENVPIYSEPYQMSANISEVRGLATTRTVGIEVDYDATILTHDLNCPIDEKSVLWVNTNPNDDEPFDYIVRRVAKSLNVITILIKRVDIS